MDRGILTVMRVLMREAAVTQAKFIEVGKKKRVYTTVDWTLSAIVG